MAFVIDDFKSFVRCVELQTRQNIKADGLQTRQNIKADGQTSNLMWNDNFQDHGFGDKGNWFQVVSDIESALESSR